MKIPSPCLALLLFAFSTLASAELVVRIPAAFAVAGEKILGTFSNKDTSELRVCSAADGKLLQSVPLPAPAIRDGIAIASGRVFISCRDGSLVCFGQR